VRGVRPIASSATSNSTREPSASSALESANPVTPMPVRMLMPSARKAHASSSLASGSSLGSSLGAVSTIVTLDPSRAKAWPSSQPTPPPPSTSSRPGSSVRSQMVSLV